MARWTADQIPDLSGQTAIVTGANTGIGYETALELARKGADVILACRNPDKGAAAVARIEAEGVAGTAVLELLDLSDLDHVADCATRITQRGRSIDYLVLNAGVMVPPQSTTAQGFELQFGVNHLGHFALCGRLLPQMNPQGRVVVVSSTAASFGKMVFDDLQFERRGYDGWRAYGQSKLANQLFTLELQRRLTQADSQIVVTACHPGWTQTDLQRTSKLASILNPFFGMKAWQGALPTLLAAVDPQAKGGEYYGPDGWFQGRGYPIQVPMVAAAHREQDAAELWSISERLSGVVYTMEPTAS